MNENYSDDTKNKSDDIIASHDKVTSSADENFDISKDSDDKTNKEIDDSNVLEHKLKDKAVEEVICKALEKVKEYFFSNEIEEHKLAEFMFKILTLNVKDMNPKDFQMSSEVLDQIVDQMITNTGTKTESDNFDVFDILGPDATKSITEKLCTEKIDDLVQRLLGEDTKKLICEKLESQSLDELLNKLIDEKLRLDEDPQAKHPNFDDFIEKILSKETEEYVKKKLEVYLHEISSNAESKVKDLEQL